MAIAISGIDNNEISVYQFRKFGKLIAAKVETIAAVSLEVVGM